MRKMILLLIGILISLGLYIHFLPEYVCFSAVYDSKFPSRRSPVEVCAKGTTNPSRIEYVYEFFKSINPPSVRSLDRVFSNSNHAASAGIERYSDLLVKNFSDGKNLSLVVDLDINGKRFLSVKKEDYEGKLSLVLEGDSKTGYLFYDSLSDAFWSGMLAAFSLGTVNYESYKDYFYVLKPLGYDGGRRLPGDMGSCCFARLSDVVEVLQGERLKNSTEYKNYQKYIDGLDDSSIPRNIFYNSKDYMKILTAINQDDGAKKTWNLGAASRLYKGPEASILALDEGSDAKVVLFVGKVGSEKIYGLTKRTIIDKLIWLNYAKF